MSTNAHFGVGGQQWRPENNQNPEIKHIHARFRGWEVAATGEGQSETPKRAQILVLGVVAGRGRAEP